MIDLLSQVADNAIHVKIKGWNATLSGETVLQRLRVLLRDVPVDFSALT